MTDFTRIAIRRAFIKLLNEKPLKHISVRDIVDECGINRNTFYYHFRDIPTLMESIIEDEADRLIREHPPIESMEDCLNAIIGYSLANKRAVLHIYRSVSRDVFEQHQWRVCEYAVSAYVDQILAGHSVSRSDRDFIVSYLKCVSFGFVMGWLESGLQEDIQGFTHRFCQLKLGNLDEIIARCEENQQ